ncbi:GNAT family N-acetyltransferase [Streptomyces sp. CAU 1734]|uniref:GNAT family N-acetyltransferase n=1 Tax=Streptomyces sp. CAU 1734 TaxID=3140360 RepID=UPI003260AF55
MTIETRGITESELPEWLRAMSTGFLMAPTPGEREIELRRSMIDFGRTQGAFDRGRCVATYRAFAQHLSVVGGGTVVSNGITNVSVSATHRRRGLLTRMITDDLTAARDRGDMVASLIAAEYPIYGRYGFGPATWTAQWSIDVPRTGLDPRRAGPAGGGRIDLVDGADVRELGPALHARLEGVRAGVVRRKERWWQAATGEVQLPSMPWTEPFYAVYRSASGEIDGLAVYSADDTWGDAKQPLNTLRVRDLLAVNPAAERALWQFLCSIDWVVTVRSGNRAPDDLLPQYLPDPRAARITTLADMMWLRILDVPRALEARGYAVSAGLVLELRDRMGLAGGRFRLEVSPEGAECVPTAGPADLTMDIGELGALYLGDASPVRLAALGTVEENRPGAAAVAESVFRTPRRPWCPDIF